MSVETSERDRSSLLIAGTGVPAVLPKSEFAARLQSECEAALREERPVSIVVVDLDHFKSVNDAFGHIRGDQTLEEFTRRAMASARESDLIFRFGGDEFVFVLPGAGAQAARGQAERLLQRVSAVPFAGDPPLSLTLSIGVATLPDDAVEAARLFELADQRLYTAKRLGRARVIGSDATPAPKLATEGSRLIERDQPRELVFRFLNDLPQRRRASLVIRGTPGSGRTAFLLDARHAGELLGYRTVLVSGRAALRERAFDALLLARDEFGGIVAIPGTELDEPLGALIESAEERGLLILIDNIHDVDEATLDALTRLLRSRRIPVIGLICTLDGYQSARAYIADAPPAEEISLEPLSREATRSLLRVLLRQELPETSVHAIYAATSGQPRAVRLAADLVSGAPHSSIEQICARLEEQTGPRPCKLPDAPSSIVGRSREIEEGKRLLASSRMVSLLGAGGMGKTRLALQIARESVELFDSGVYYAALGDEPTPEFITTAIAHTLGLQPGSGRELKLQLYDYLRDKSLLLVLDNLESVPQAGIALLSELLAAAPGLRLIVTSRERLHLYEEVVLNVGGLAYPRTHHPRTIFGYPAVQLFIQRARKGAPRFAPTAADLESIVRICEAVDGMPLALEMAASMVRLLSCQQIERQIGGGLDALVTPLRDVPERHRSMRAVVESSWLLLDPTEQAAARRLAVFPRDFGIDAALALGISLPTLLALADKSILRQTVNGRFELHRVVRYYAQELLAQNPRDQADVLARFTTCFAHFLHARRETLRSRGSRVALQEITDEIENVRVTWRHAVASGDESLIRLCIDTLFEFYDRRGWYREAQELFHWAEALPPQGELLGAVLTRFAHFCLRTGNVNAAASAVHRASPLVRSTGDGRELGLVLRIAAELARSRGHYRASGRLLHSAIAHLRSAHAQHELAACMNDLGLTEWARGRNEQAQRQINISLHMRRELGDEVGVVKCLMNLAILADAAGNGEEAEQRFAECVQLSRELGDRRQVALSLHNLGVFLQRRAEQTGDQLRVIEAQQLLEESLRISRDLGDRHQICHTVCMLGDVALLQNNVSAATAHYDEAVRLAAELGVRPLQARTLLGIGMLQLRAADFDAGEQTLAAVVAERATDEHDRARAAGLLHAVRARLGRSGSEHGMPPAVAELVWHYSRREPLGTVIGNQDTVRVIHFEPQALVDP